MPERRSPLTFQEVCSSLAIAFTEKLGWYRQYGVRECWLVDTEAAQVTRIDLTGPQPDVQVVRGVSLIHSVVLPELRMRAVAIF